MTLRVEFLDTGIFYVIDSPQIAQRGVAILTHGLFADSVGPARLGVKTAEVLTGMGFAVVRFDMRGCGQSAGRQRDLTLATQTADLEAVAAFVAREFSVSADEIVHVGLSFGGVSVSLLQGLPTLQRICLINVPADLRQVFSRQSNLIQKAMLSVAGRLPLPFLAGQVLEFQGNELSYSFLEESLRYDWQTAWSRFRGRALIVQSDRDELVPPAHAREIGDILRSSTAGGSVVFTTIRGADHLLSRLKYQAEMFEAIERFLK